MFRAQFLFIILFTPICQGVSQYLLPGNDAIEFHAQTEEGKTIRLSDYHGKYVLIEFAGTACAPCWESYPHLTEIQEKFSDTLQVFTFHAYDTLKSMWKKIALAKKVKVNWITVWEVEDKKEIMDQYKINGMPIYYLIDPNGKILTAWFGYKRKKLEREMNKYLVKR